MTRTTSNVGKPGFILGVNYDANDGRQIDWDNVSDTNDDGEKIVKAGTVMAETGDGLIAPRKEKVEDGDTNEYEATSILLATAEEDDTNDAISGYGVVVGGVVFENMLPDSDETDFDDWLTELKENGTGFVFEEYSDDRTN